MESRLISILRRNKASLSPIFSNFRASKSSSSSSSSSSLNDSSSLISSSFFSSSSAKFDSGTRSGIARNFITCGFRSLNHQNLYNKDVTAQKASKNHIRFQVRERRADAKKALRSLLLNGGSIHINVQAERDTSLDTDDSKPPFASRRAAKAQHKRMKRQRRREKNYESDDANVFQAAFRKKGYKWASWSETDFSYESCTGFEWKEQPKRNFRRQRDSDIDSDIESDSESCVKDIMYSERKALDLPLTGPLKIEAIKAAFRVSALKWHPDKHQGSSQTMAEEKFKHCVDAYKSLCNSVSTA